MAEGIGIVKKRKRIFVSGFTLIELAIVLVVIGLLVGLALKGKSMIESAKIKSDINNLNKIGAAIGAYYTTAGNIPGMNSKEIFDNLTEKGNYINESDFTIKSLNAYWNVIPCMTARGADEGWMGQIDALKVTYYCAYVGDNPGDGGTVPAGSRSTLKFLCYVETQADDRNWLTGAGRTMGAVDAIPAVPDWDCSEASDDRGVYPYMYRVF